MKQLLSIAYTDLRQILREPMLWVLLIPAPLLVFLIARLFVPWVEGFFPTLADYHPAILLLMILQITTGAGFVMAAILLDEKDEQVASALRVLPISNSVFLFQRLLLAMLLAFGFTFFMLTYTGLLHLPLALAAFIGLLFALLPPVIVLVLVRFTSNKVESLAVFKIIAFVLILPVASLYLPDPLGNLFIWLPNYWTIQTLGQALEGQAWIGTAMVSLLFHLALIGVLLRYGP